MPPAKPALQSDEDSKKTPSAAWRKGRLGCNPCLWYVCPWSAESPLPGHISPSFLPLVTSLVTMGAMVVSVAEVPDPLQTLRCSPMVLGCSRTGTARHGETPPSREVSHGHSVAWHHAVTCQQEWGPWGFRSCRGVKE